MKQPNLKARLISSVLVLVMMITSLLGTTFAWFTDLAVSGGNTIQVGSLKVGLYHKVGEDDWKSIKDNSNHKIFDYDKWEPGYTRFETLKIANLGNLALQYKLSIEVAGRAVTGSNGENLADVIDVYVVDGENTSSSSWTYKGTLTQVMRNPSSFIGGQLLAREENVVSIVLRMQTTAGNAYQGLDVGDIYVNLVATQWNYEKDSFDNPDYDKDSTFPELNIGGVSVSVNTNYNNVVTNTVSVSGEGVEATIPAGVEVDNGVNKLTLSVTEKENSDANLTLNDGEALRSLDVHISGVSKDNEKPMLITVEKAMKVGLNMGNYTLYHVEDGVSNAMTAVDSLAELDEHNEFYYDPATGNVTLAMATFSEVAFVAETNPVWEGNIANSFAGGSGTEEDPYLIANADQLAYLGDLISNDNANYGDKYYKLVADINLGGEENANKGIIFYPIGYHKVGGAVASLDLNDAPEFIYHETDPAFTKGTVNVIADRDSTAWYTYGGAFKGVFDGNGNTISNIYQNTWQMKGNYDGNYWNSAMGVFGYVYGGTVKNLTVDNFSSDGEFTPTGVIAAYAAGKSTFENIAITNCNPRVYNTGNGGIIGIAGSTTNANDDHITLKNITVDNTNKISALWGSWDVACGGLVGMYRGNVDGSGNATGDTISFENCHVSAQIDVYNDVCANYQYYAYRYSGMIIGSVRHNTTSNDGRTVPNMEGISASGCTVNYGDWNDYYYCEFEKNTMASYSEDYQFSRVDKSEIIFDANGNAIGCTHDHTDAEDKRAVYLPFYQLFTGYSWGVSSIGLKEYSGIVTNLGITEGDQQGSVEKFEGKVNALVNYTTYKLGDIFSFVDNGVKLIPSSIVVSVTYVDENNPVSATIVYNYATWENTIITFTGAGVITITIQDYYFCTPTTITVDVKGHEHVYDNGCDVECNACGETRAPEHTEVIDEAKAPTCTATGLTEGKHCSVCNEVLVAQKEVAATGHSYNEVVTAPTCTTAGYTTYTCSVCGDTYKGNEVAALGHDYKAVVTEPDCENGGYTTYTCSVCNHSYTADEVDACGHTYNAVVTAPTCTEAGYTTYTCACGDTYTGDEVAALGHDMVTDDAKAPTCTETGLTEGSHCSRCDYKVAQETVAAKGHTEVVDEAVAATCTATGLTEGKHCSVCNEVLVAQTVVSAKGHTEVVDEAVAATCTTAGLTEGKHCSICNTVLVAQTTVAAKGHTEVTDKAVAPTCTATGLTEGKHCSVCKEVLTAQTTVAALGHITTNFTGDFLYRVGNQNAVELISLFNVENRNVDVSGANVAGNASVKVDGTSLKFSGTGVVKVTLSSDCTCGECVLELTLEVVDAVNATSATSATSNNVVLLNDCGFSSLEVSGGYTLYGNGFTMTCGSDSVAIDRTYSFVALNGGTLDNVKIVVPNFSHSIMYEKNKTENGNPSNTDSSGRTRYNNIRSAVLVSATSTITNSYISGGRAAIYLTSGQLTVKNSTIYGGAVANIQTEASSHLILEDATLIQEPIKANVNDTSKTVMGFSVVMMCDTNGNGSPVTIKGYLHQYAWAHKGYTQYVPSDGQSAISAVLNKEEFIHSITYEDGKTANSVNLGFAYMPDGTTGTNANNMADERSDSEKGKYPYEKTEVTVATIVATIYTYKNTNGTDDAVKTEPTYIPTTQGMILPSVQYSETNENRVLTTTYDKANAQWKTTLKVDVDAGVYTFSFAKLLAQKYGKNLSYVIKTADGTVVDNNTTITLNSAISNVYYLTITDNQIYDKNGNLTGETVEITYMFELQSTKTSLPAPTWTSTTLNGTPYIVVDSKDGDWNCAVPVLDGLKIKYWSKKQNKEVELVLADVVSAAGLSKGLQNGTNNTITITVADEYILTITTTGFKTNDNGKPVVVDGKLYFTVSSSSNYVSTKTTDRTVSISYSFTDANNSNPISLSTSFKVEYATYKSKQYNYSDFCKGTLTEATSCVTPDTLITLADGTQVRVDSLTGDEMLLVWNMETGKLDSAPIMFVDSDAEAEFEVIKLYFSDGTEVKVIYEHGFWDYDLNKYVYLDKNAADYIGHTFAKQNGDSLEKVQLVDVVIETEVTEAWSPVTTGHLCYFVNGMLSMPGGVGGLFNIFDVNPETMTYDYEQMEKDIETYGLYTYEELNAICPLSEDMFNAAGGAYLKISIGKGNLTEEELFAMINRYSKFFN